MEEPCESNQTAVGLYGHNGSQTIMIDIALLLMAVTVMIKLTF